MTKAQLKKLAKIQASSLLDWWLSDSAYFLSQENVFSDDELQEFRKCCEEVMYELTRNLDFYSVGSFTEAIRIIQQENKKQ